MGETSILAGRRRPLLLFARRMSVRGVVPAYVSLREDIALQRRLSQLSYIAHDANSTISGGHPLVSIPSGRVLSRSVTAARATALRGTGNLDPIDGMKGFLRGRMAGGQYCLHWH